MDGITSNEMRLILAIFKSPEADYNANSIAQIIGITPMGALKIAKRLEKRNVLLPKQLGRARFYKLNMHNKYARQYISFLLNREAEQSTPYIRVWVNEARKIKSADAAILFGSVLKNEASAGDIDILFVTDKKRFPKLKKEIEEINMIHNKKIHPMFQTGDDFIKNIKIRDKPLLSAIKGVVAFGGDMLLSLLEK